MIFYEYVCSRWTTGDDGQLPVHMLDGHLRGPMLLRGQTPRRAFGKGADWLKVAQVSIFWTGGVGVFGAIGFAGIMDNIPPHLALPGVLQRGQAADCS